MGFGTRGGWYIEWELVLGVTSVVGRGADGGGRYTGIAVGREEKGWVHLWLHACIWSLMDVRRQGKQLDGPETWDQHDQLYCISMVDHIT